MRAIFTAFMFFTFMTTPVLSETELGFYGGAQNAPPSRVHGSDPGGIGIFDFVSAWENSSSRSVNYGVRLTWWQNDNWGWGLDFSHDAVQADGVTLSDNGLAALGFSEGLNILTVNRYRQWGDLNGSFVPYVGAGLGVSVPSLEFTSGAGSLNDFQLGGPAVSVIAGARYPVNEKWSLFGEYKGTYSSNTLDLNSGGTLRANIFTNSLNVGATFGF